MGITTRKIRRFMTLMILCTVLVLLPVTALAGENDDISVTGQNGVLAADGVNIVGGSLSYGRVWSEATGSYSDTVRITEAEKGITKAVIPDRIDGMPVVAISEVAFQDHTSLESITFPKYLRETGSLYGCTALTTVDFSRTTDALTAVSQAAFRGCTELTSVDLPEGIISIGANAFYGCSSLESITMPETVEIIGAEAFSECTALTSVTLPSGLKTLGEKAFFSCGKLTSADFSGLTALKVIPGHAFSCCRLSSVAIPDCVETIGKGAFDSNGYREENTSFNETIFYTLKTLTLGTGVKSIGEGAFANSQILTLTLPDSLTSIGADAFLGCSALSSIRWPNNAAFTEVRGFSECTSLPGSVVAALPDSVHTIGEDAFEGCGFTAVTIPAQIRVIGEGAFRDCEDLAAITVLPGTETIGGAAFAGCTGLVGKTVELPASVSTVNAVAFSGIQAYTANVASDPKTPLTVKFYNRDVVFPSGDGDYFACYAPEDTARENPITDPFYESCYVEIYGYALNSRGNASQPRLYAEWMNNKTINILWYEGENSTGMHQTAFTRVIGFHEMDAPEPVYHTVSGTLPEQASAVVRRGNADVSVVTKGRVFSASVQEGADVSVTVSQNGCYDKVYLKSSNEYVADWNLGSVETGAVLPATGRMYVELIRADAQVAPGSFEGLTLELKEGSTTLVQGQDYSVQYPYIIMKTPNDTQSLTLTVTPDAAMKLAGAADTATQKEGRFTLVLPSLGRISVSTVGTFAGGNNVLVFDDSGAVVTQGVTEANSFATDGLAAGTYTVVSFNCNALFSSAASLNALNALGLIEGTDYAKTTVTVVNGSTAAASLTVPLLDTAKLTEFLDVARCGVTAEESFVIVGQTLNLRVFFALAQGKDNIPKTVNFTVPDGLTLESVCSSNGLLSPTATTYTANEAEGIYYLRLKVNRTGNYTVGASMTYNGITVPLGSASIEADPVFLDVANTRMDTRNGVAVITATPDTAIDFYVGGSATPLKAKANHGGRASISFDLPADAEYGRSYVLRAVTSDGEASETVTFLPGATILKKLTFIHAGRLVTVLDKERPEKEDAYYTYVANGQVENHYWSFYAELEGGAGITDAVLAVEMMDGSVRAVPLTVTEAESTANGTLSKCAAELYILPAGDHVFDDSIIPVGFTVDWNKKPLSFEPDFATLTAQANARIEARKQLTENALANAEAEDTPETEESLRAALKTAMGYDTANAEEKKQLDAVIDELVAAWTEEIPDSAISMFGYAYRVSDDKEFAELFTSLKPSDPDYSDYMKMGARFRADVYEVERLLDKACEICTQLFRLPKPIQEYDSWNQVYEAMGLVYTANGAASQNETMTQTGDTRYSMLREGGGCSQVNTSSDGAYRLDVGSGEPQTGLVLMDDGLPAQLTPEEAAELGTGMVFLSHSIGAQIDDMETIVKNEDDLLKLIRRPDLREEIKAEAKTAGKAVKRFRVAEKVVGATGNALAAVQVYGDGNAYCDNTVELAELKGQKEHLDVLHKFYFDHYVSMDCWDSLVAEERKLAELISLLEDKSTHLVCNMSVGAVSIVGSLWSGGTSAAAGVAYDYASADAASMRDFAIAALSQEYSQLKAAREKNCGELSQYKGRRVTPILDPSGLVYEALESNVLAGVTATIYVAEDDAGSNPREWNAEAYSQQNPQTTPTDGAYAWNVPAGFWQVRFTKAGYQDAATAWMEVPPPRMNLLTAMVSTAAPSVSSANAYPDYIELLFSQYMDKSASLTLPEGMTGIWQGSEKYSKVLRITKAGGFASDAVIPVSLSGAVNYAGTAMADYSAGLTVSVRPAEVLLNYENTVVMKAGETPSVTVRVKDSEGNYMSGVKVNAEIANSLLATVDASALTDSLGTAVFHSAALLPGLTNITFTVNGTSLSKELALRVTAEALRPARPTANVGRTNLTAASPKENYVTVSSGTSLVLAAEDGVTIYYTTDDTCPCQNSPSRHVYSGPVTLTANAKYRIAGYKDGMDYSERLNITVTISSGGGGGGTVAASNEVKASDVENGVVRLSSTGATAGTAVTITLVAEEGYESASPKVTDGKGNLIPVTDLGNGQYSFTMPDSPVTVDAEFLPEGAVSGTDQFTDVSESDWFSGDVDYVFANGLMNGISDTLFDPHGTTSRAMVVTILWRLAGEPVAGASNTFTDVPGGQWYTNAVAWASANDIVKGYPEGGFGPEDSVTREQLATILYNYEKLRGGGFTGEWMFLLDFADAGQVSDWANEAMHWCTMQGIINGTDKGMLDPQGSAERCQVAAILHRFCELK